jgi:hypothetical protein
MGDVLLAANERVTSRPDVIQVPGLFNYLGDLGRAAFFNSVHGLLPIHEPCVDDIPIRVRDVVSRVLDEYLKQVRFPTLHGCRHSCSVVTVVSDGLQH